MVSEQGGLSGGKTIILVVVPRDSFTYGGIGGGVGRGYDPGATRAVREGACASYSLSLWSG